MHISMCINVHILNVGSLRGIFNSSYSLFTISFARPMCGKKDTPNETQLFQEFFFFVFYTIIGSFSFSAFIFLLLIVECHKELLSIMELQAYLVSFSLIYSHHMIVDRIKTAHKQFDLFDEEIFHYTFYRWWLE